jgi:GTP cyclohydrolase II
MTASPVSVRLPVAAGEARCYVTPGASEADQVVVLEFGVPGSVPVPLVRVHSACLTGDILGSLRCDCGPQLHAALDRLATADWGLLVYLCGHEGRGIGIVEKMRAYNLQDEGYDTFEANELLGHPADARDYSGATAALHSLGVACLDLLTSNPLKAHSLEHSGIRVRSTIPLELPCSPHNERYIATKQAWFADIRSGHEAASSVPTEMAVPVVRRLAAIQEMP